MFSPMRAISARRVSSTVSPEASLTEFSASRSFGCASSAALRDRRGEGLEVLLAGDEIRLGVDLDHGGRAAVGGTLDRDHAFGGDAPGLLVGLGEARLAHDLGRGFEVAVGLDQRLLAFHHAGAGALTQRLHCLCGDGHDHASPFAASASTGATTGRRHVSRRGSLLARSGATGHECLGALLRVGLDQFLGALFGAGVGLDGTGLAADGRGLLPGRGGAALRAARLRTRLAFLVEFDEFVLADRHVRDRRTAFDHRIGDAGGVQLDGAHGVVVAGDHVADAVRRAVGVDHGDDRDARASGPREWRSSRDPRRRRTARPAGLPCP